MKHKWWLVTLLLVGVLVAGLSLYQVSVSGAIEKMGLVGQVGEEMFEHKSLVMEIEHDAWWQCQAQAEIIGSLQYYLSFGEHKIWLGWQLGQERIRCGTQQVARGDGLSGTYKILRGAKYWEQSLLLMEQNNGVCVFVPPPEDVEHLSRLVVVARGSARVAIGQVEEKVKERIKYETERCIDQGK